MQLLLSKVTLSLGQQSTFDQSHCIRIFKVFREVKSVTTLEDKSLVITRGNKLRSARTKDSMIMKMTVIFIIIESGMDLFVVQLARVAISINLTPTTNSDSQNSAFQIIVAIHELVNVIYHQSLFTDNVHLTRAWHLRSSWCECRWDYLSMMRNLWSKVSVV